MAKRKVKLSNQVAVSDATRVVIKPERDKKSKSEIRQAPIKGSEVLLGVVKRALGPIGQGLMMGAGAGGSIARQIAMSSGGKKLLNLILHDLPTVAKVKKTGATVSDIKFAIRNLQTMRSQSISEKGVNVSKKLIDNLDQDTKTLEKALTSLAKQAKKN